MKIEYNNNYDEFFQGAVGELQKTIAVKLYALELCNLVLNEQMSSKSFKVPNYDVQILTNK